VNARHDVALVEAMLRVVKTAKGTPTSPATTTAPSIRRQERDHQLSEGPKAGGAATGRAARTEKTDSSVWWADHHQALGHAAGYARDLRVIENTTTVYVAGTATDAATAKSDVSARVDLERRFAPRWPTWFNRCSTRTRSCCGSRRRGPAHLRQQAAFPRRRPRLAPRSNHNFGRRSTSASRTCSGSGQWHAQEGQRLAVVAGGTVERKSRGVLGRSRRSGHGVRSTISVELRTHSSASVRPEHGEHGRSLATC